MATSIPTTPPFDPTCEVCLNYRYMGMILHLQRATGNDLFNPETTYDIDPSLPLIKKIAAVYNVVRTTERDLTTSLVSATRSNDVAKVAIITIHPSFKKIPGKVVGRALVHAAKHKYDAIVKLIRGSSCQIPPKYIERANDVVKGENV